MDTDSLIFSRSAPNTYFAPKVVNSTDAVCVEAPVRTVVRAGEGRAVASALGVVAALEAPPPLRPDPPPAPQGSRGPSQK